MRHCPRKEAGGNGAQVQGSKGVGERPFGFVAFIAL